MLKMNQKVVAVHDLKDYPLEHEPGRVFARKGNELIIVATAPPPYAYRVAHIRLPTISFAVKEGDVRALEEEGSMHRHIPFEETNIGVTVLRLPIKHLPIPVVLISFEKACYNEVMNADIPRSEVGYFASVAGRGQENVRFFLAKQASGETFPVYERGSIVGTVVVKHADVTGVMGGYTPAHDLDDYQDQRIRHLHMNLMGSWDHVLDNGRPTCIVRDLEGFELIQHPYRNY